MMKTSTFYGDCKHLSLQDGETECFCKRRGKWITDCKYCKSFETCLDPGAESLCVTCAYCVLAPEEKKRIGKYICVHEVYPSKTRPHYVKGLSTCRLYRRKE